MKSSKSASDSNRFQVSKATLRLDRFMNRFIFVGGLGVIFAVFGIFFFILLEIIPLFTGAEVRKLETESTGIESAVVLGTDEWTELPFVITEHGDIHFIDRTGEGQGRIEKLGFGENVQISSSNYLQDDQIALLGLSNGEYQIVRIQYKPQFAEDGSRTIEVEVISDKPEALVNFEAPIQDIDGFVSSDLKTIAGIIPVEDGHRVQVVTQKRKRSLFGSSKFSVEADQDLSPEISGEPTDLLVGADASILIVANDAGEVFYFHYEGTDWNLRQSFRPFSNDGDGLASIDFIQGSVSLNLTSKSGQHVVYSLYRSVEQGERIFGKTKDFEPFDSGADVYARSLRNKAFLMSNDEKISLRYSTTTDIRWETEAEYDFEHLVISGKFDRILGLTKDGTLVSYALQDPHPEAGFRAFFSKIWYEGQEQPEYVWQSTGGSDDFEPKLSLIPLIIGSLKGTVYAMIFAFPIAILSAIYTSQFLKPEFKRIIKPSLEIMASLPSVVLGFLAALWLAPLIEDRIPSVILMMTLIPTVAILVGFCWNLLPIKVRLLIPKGWEFILFLPIIVIIAWLGWILGPVFEQLAFRVDDPTSGQSIADFRLWWESAMESQFQQRNSLVVGFIMGFAVIPIIYTIADDALSAVPKALVSGSLALGASRWQTTARIVLPTASAGIFSATMIGFGRAVGETMIVVMATGNTPILDFDIFSGMRTLSANIAVELPEAPHSGTLYRTLFLGAFVLFIMTFTVNTFAEVMRNRLREKYKVIS